MVVVVVVVVGQGPVPRKMVKFKPKINLNFKHGFSSKNM